MDDIVEIVQSRLRSSNYPALRRLTCESERGKLHLRGQLPNYYHKQLAHQAVSGFENVQVIDETKVGLA